MNTHITSTINLISSGSFLLRQMISAMRPAHWIKNLFVFAPLIFSQNLFHPEMFLRVFSAFLIFCAAASATYLINDVKDRDLDRTHPTKAKRSIASGDLSVGAAVITALILSVLCLAFGWLLSTRFLLILLTYLLLNVLYSFFLKKIVILDVMSVATGFMLRVLSGSVAIWIQTSRWLIICTGVIALFLSIGKRRHEFVHRENLSENTTKVYSNYTPYFLDQMMTVVAASTLISYALYTISEETVKKFGTINLIYTIPFVVYGVFRYLYLVHRKEKSGDITQVIISDVPLVLNMILWLIVVIWILYI